MHYSSRYLTTKTVAEGKAARALAQEDREEAVRLWQDILGEDYFPSSVSLSAQEVASRLLPGTAFVTGTGMLGESRSDARPSVVTRPTRFYGEKSS